MSCSYIPKQLRRNSLQLQSFDSFCCLSWLQKWQCGITFFNIVLSIARMFIKLIKMLFPLFLICYTAVPERRRYPGDYHLPRIKPFYYRNDYNYCHVFLFRVSNQYQVSYAFDWLKLLKKFKEITVVYFFLKLEMFTNLSLKYDWVSPHRSELVK